MARGPSLLAPLNFIEEDGRPMKFFMKPCSLWNKVSRIIEEAGGILTSELTDSEEIIRLTDPEKPVEGFVSSDFVFDSAKKQCLQDINKYRIMSKKTKQTTEIVRNSNEEEENSPKTVNRHTNRRVEVVDFDEICDTKDAHSPRTKSKKTKKTTKIVRNGNDEDEEDSPNTVNRNTKRRVKVVDYDKMCHIKDANSPRAKSKKTNQATKIVRNGNEEEEDSPETVNQHTNRRVKVMDYDKMRNNKVARSPRKKKRKKYTKEDDDAILKYIEQEDINLHGNVIWKRMAYRKVTNHTWQSMRKHYIEILKERHNLQEDQNTSAGQRTSSNQTSKSPRKNSKKTEKDDTIESDSDFVRNSNKAQARPPRSKHKVMSSSESTDDQSLGGVPTRNDAENSFEHQRIIRRSPRKSNDYTANQRAVTTRSHARSEIQAIKEKDEEAHQSDTDNESSPDTFDEYSQQVPRQETPVFPRKDREQHGSSATRRHHGGVPSSKGKDATPTKVAHIYPNVRVTTANHQDGVDWGSDSEEFDQRLLSLAEKASFERSCQESQSHEERSENETSAKDTQEDDEDEYIFRLKNRRKRTERNKNQLILSAKRKCTDNEEKRTLRVMRGMSSKEKPSVDVACECPSKSPHKRRKRDETPETCSRDLFGDNTDETSTHKAKGINRKASVTTKTPDDDEMWLYVEKMAEQFKKVEKLPCTRGMSRSQLLHALYVSNGDVKDTESYIKTGHLTNGGRPWSKKEDAILMRDERELVKTIVKKRTQSSVWERKAFLRGCN